MAIAVQSDCGDGEVWYVLYLGIILCLEGRVSADIEISDMFEHRAVQVIERGCVVKRNVARMIICGI